jgi:hypothetical protein
MSTIIVISVFILAVALVGLCESPKVNKTPKAAT